MPRIAFVPTPPPSIPPSSAFFSNQPVPPNCSKYVLYSRKRSPAAFSFPNPFDPKKIDLFVSEINVINPIKLPQSVIDLYITPMKKQRVLLQEIFHRVELVNKWFIENGYACSRLLILRIPRWRSKALVLFSTEPRLTALRRIAVDKDGKAEEGGKIITRERTICNAIGLQIGDVFRWKREDFSALMQLGIFDFASAEVNVVNNHQVELVLHLRERSSGRVEPGMGLSSDGFVYGDVSIVENNLFGRAQKLRLEWQKRIDLARSSGGISFEDMRIGAEIPLSFRVRAYRDSNAGRALPGSRVSSTAVTDAGRLEGSSTARSSNPSDTPLRFEKDRDGVLLDVGYHLKGSNVLINLVPVLENVHGSVHRTGRDASNPVSNLQTVLQTCFTHGTRPVVDLPREGHMVRLEHFVGCNVSTRNKVFRKTIVRLSQYFGVGSKASLAIGTTVGIGSQNLPWHEQKSLGGPTSVRGYEYGELGRYKSYGYGRLELRVPLGTLEEASDRVDTGTEKKEEGGEDGGEKSKGEKDAEGSKKSGISLPGGLLDKMPPLVGVLFGDVAVADVKDSETVGACYGVGVRVGGVVGVNWVVNPVGRRSGLHVGLIDRNL